MLINIINTALIACGMAVNTTNFNSEQKPIKQLVNNVVVQEEIQYTEVDNYTIDNKTCRKFYYRQETPNPNYTNDKYNIYNTTYTYYVEETDKTTYQCITLLAITTYYDFTYESIAINQQLEAYNNNNTNSEFVYYLTNYETTSDILSVINLTMTVSNVQRVEQFINATINTGTNKETESSSTTIDNSYTRNIDNEYSIDNIAADNTRYIVMITSLIQTSDPTNNVGSINPIKTNLYGVAQIPSNEYHIIDVPNLMLTVLTLPFSFISQAFNLTIFPGTPYALNFSNLFRTIVAIFVLLWIIKKIFK